MVLRVLDGMPCVLLKGAEGGRGTDGGTHIFAQRLELLLSQDLALADLLQAAVQVQGGHDGRGFV
jgi:hypothetical protein